MRINKSYSSVAADTDGLADNVAPASGVALTLIANSAADSCAHKIIFTNNSSTDYSGGGKTLTIVGTAADGSALTEAVTGPAGSTTSTSSGYFLTVTSVTPNFTRGTTDTIDIGWTAAAVTPPINVQLRPGAYPRSMGIGADVSGSAAYTLQQSYGGNWYNHAAIATKTGDADGSILFPVALLRLIFTAASAVNLNIVTAD